MVHNILLTGASGYLGGSILAQLRNSSSDRIGWPVHVTIYRLVRSDNQAQTVRDYGAEPAWFDPGDEVAIESFILDHEVSVVVLFIDVVNVERQTLFIRALAKLQRQTGQEFISCRTVIYLAEELDVKSYIVAPCIVYGEGLGFGNKISGQIVSIVKAAKEVRLVYCINDNSPTWPVCHISDNNDFYIRLLAAILSGSTTVGYGRRGYYLPSPGSVAWDDLNSYMAVALANKGIIEDERVTMADDAALEAMSCGLKCPKAYVRVQLAGKCTFTLKHGTEALGWVPKFAPEHILKVAEAEVGLILKHI
ncbi:uncharacterized protein TRIVIDRAFT_190948 [Trichoderma virens Gv29-8]|uniref:NAD-dependent epimerase/dehydratase domain-containing protein n=1 Tax=Hypocrea virens (strain Gv29-8 / FGSC 10586) TaxID=413071 RepID=G9MQN5_HYPVG|nr:uncharacterized protein TRIVIDRAFT_190948 [Trichoderma virens Gv29-8]EHK24102.1 hypothetical protein TRIVIDRAFT_190948 [Trichoderma virens Gv29-8]